MSSLMSVKAFLGEAHGIQHLEHLADHALDSKQHLHKAIGHLKKVVSGEAPKTKKIDDRMSFHAVRHDDGRVGIKYKGSGDSYSYSEHEIEQKHGHKPYKAEPLKAIHRHLHKVLPHRAGEWQGGYMSSHHEREHSNEHVSHTPNTITYSAKKNSAEGKKLARSKVSVVIHSELKGKDKTAHPVSHRSFREHPDVHIVPHDVDHHPHEDDKKQIHHHIKTAEMLAKGHDDRHHEGHSQHMRSYIHSTVETGEKPSAEGYKKHLAAKHDKAIAAVSTDKAKERKSAQKEADLAHIDKHKKAFDRTFEIHHHIQQAVSHTARSLDKHDKDYHTSINGSRSGSEGYVSGGYKLVDREGFTKANRERSKLLRSKKLNEMKKGTDGVGKRQDIDLHHYKLDSKLSPGFVVKIGRYMSQRQPDETKHLNVSELHGTQDTISKAGIHRASDKPIEVAHWKGKHYIMDGHHRAVKHILDGKSKIKASIHHIPDDI